MKTSGVIQEGAYKGQEYTVVGNANFPGWWKVELRSGERSAVREVRESVLEYEW